MKHSPTGAALALILAAMLPAIAPGADAPATGAAPTPGTAAASAPRPAPTLEGTSWSPTAYRVGDALIEMTAGGRPGRFRFEAGHLSGSAGCNQIGGAYTLAGDRLTFKPTIRSTMMACPEPLMKQEQAVGLALTRVAAYRLDGERLELLDATGGPLLSLLAMRPAPLVGQWQLTGYNNGKQAMVSTLNGTEITLELRDDGTLGGSDGCNRYMSGYTLTGETLTVGPLASTRMACKGRQGAAEQAGDYATALATVTGYRIEGDELILLTSADKPAARYRAAASRPVATGSAAPAGAQPSPDAQPTPTPTVESSAPKSDSGNAGKVPPPPY
ncbi:META domain-containing protein [uncultured Thiodictyon sp.]|uniref:META domain-containing protein n=1 Tax=uncultured Thiodictyon sp. TaxID=1846217 RepID=UPI0025EF6DC0|nr:META domain-containing protein [uncultured Thiodictyon sp.]